MMHPALEELYRMLEKEAEKIGLKIKITSSARYLHEQIALWLQGRVGLAIVNAVRKAVGWKEITADQNRIVTWTLNSKHLVTPQKPYSEAFDIVILKDNRPSWDIKADINEDSIPDYTNLGIIAERLQYKEYGLRWGGHFNDYCHFELRRIP